MPPPKEVRVVSWPKLAVEEAAAFLVEEEGACSSQSVVEEASLAEASASRLRAEAGAVCPWEGEASVDPKAAAAAPWPQQ